MTCPRGATWVARFPAGHDNRFSCTVFFVSSLGTLNVRFSIYHHSPFRKIEMA
jgi:hypothetical protein